MVRACGAENATGSSGFFAMIHKCAASNCSKEIPVRLLMCSGHWKQLPGAMRAKIWNEYREGQENDLHLVTQAYRDARDEAIDFLNKK
jgi:hypothetical protein